jgi:regulator of protease activity HflC (stomatin/prohibitin superfamily)
MKKIIKFLPLLILVISITSCYRAQPNGGQESVLVYKPIFFGHGGVDDTPVTTGATWCVATTDHYEFTITPITITEEFLNMIPADNTPVSFSAYIKVQAKKGETPILYNNFGVDWYSHNLQATFRTMVRDKACVYKMLDLSSKREISAKLEQDIFKDICDYAKKINLPVEIMQVSIGAITPPLEVLNETKNTAAQNQSILTQNARKNSEDARKAAEESKAIADKAYQDKFGMTTEQYLKLRQLEIEKEKIELIKDNRNVTIIFGSGGGLPLSYPVK